MCSEKLCINWFVAPGNDSSEVDTVDFIISIIIVVSAVVDQDKYQIVCESSEIEPLNVDMKAFDDNLWKLLRALDKGRHKKNQFFLGKSPKQRTPPTHRYGLGLT